MSFPIINKALLDELDKRFPERSAEIEWTEKEVWHRAGQRYVIRFLKAQFDRQNADSLNQKALPPNV